MTSKRDFDYFDSNSNDSVGKKRKRKSRFSDEQEKVFIPGLPTIIPSTLSKHQEEIYLLQLQIESLTRRLLTGDLGISDNPEERSPSPEPIYNSEGKRLNTREFRTRKKFEDERHSLIVKMMSINATYKPPSDYKPPQTKINEKVLIPQEEYPDINFVGLIIGPRGNTLKGMERDTGAKIIIRGKGSVKEGKLARKDGGPLPGEDEPLHAFVTGPNQESVLKAVQKINEVIQKGIDLPENMNDLRRSQLRELALLNGTLRENDGPRCTNCGSNAHRSWQCPDKPNVTNNVFCTNCNGVGHLAKDCKEKRVESNVNKAKIDEEYLSLMAELGEAPQSTSATSTSTPAAPRTATSTLGGPTPIASTNGATPITGAPGNDVNSANSAIPTTTATATIPMVPPPFGWPNYYDPLSYAAYNQMWDSNVWGAAATVPPPPPLPSKSDSKGDNQWAQNAQWYPGPGTSNPGMTAPPPPPPSQVIQPPPPPPPPPSMSYMYPPPPPPPIS